MRKDKLGRYIEKKRYLYYDNFYMSISSLLIYIYYRRESRGLNELIEKFGGRARISNTIIGFGDASTDIFQKVRGRTSKGLFGVGLRRLLVNAGYSVYLVPEHYTSKRYI